MLILLLLGGLASGPAAAQPSLETAFGNLYGICLFERVEASPFSNAALLARAALAPGLTNFVESNLAAIPLTPPNVEAVFRDGEVVNVVSGFTPIFTESSATIGKGQIFVGANYSYFDLSRIRGQELSNTAFNFGQNDLQGDYVRVTMPFDVQAHVFTLYGSYGITDRLDVGVALPIVNLNVTADGTIFEVVLVDNDSGCRYMAGTNCSYNGNTATPPLSLDAEAITSVSDLSEVFSNTMAVRFKYRFPVTQASSQFAAVVDMRVPFGVESETLGSSEFGTRVTLVGEYNRVGGFKPYVNLGGQFWNGEASSNLGFTVGFTQMLAERLSFAFDLLGKFDLETDPFLASIDEQRVATGIESTLLGSTIPALERDHTLNTALGVQLAFTENIQAYGSALFSLLDRGLHSTVVPTVGLAVHY